MASYDLGDLFKQVEAELKDLPAGQYQTQITDYRVTESKAGKPQIYLTHKVTAGPQAGATVDQSQTISKDSPAALKMFFITFKNLGIPETAFTNGVKLEQIGESLKGKNAAIVVEVDSYGPKVKKATLR